MHLKIYKLSQIVLATIPSKHFETRLNHDVSKFDDNFHNSEPFLQKCFQKY